MISLNTTSETVGGVFGIPEKREDELRELLVATGQAYLNQVFSQSETDKGFPYDKVKLIELFTQYSQNDAEWSFCLYYAAQQNYIIEKTFT